MVAGGRSAGTERGKMMACGRSEGTERGKMVGGEGLEPPTLSV